MKADFSSCCKVSSAFAARFRGLRAGSIVLVLAVLITPVSLSAQSVFSKHEETSLLRDLAKLEPIDAHSHAVQINAGFMAMLDRWDLHLIDIVVDSDKPADELEPFKQNVIDHFAFVKASHGHAVVCTTFDPYRFNNPDFDRVAIDGLNRDFARGAIAVKIWKNIGMEIKDSSGKYVMPDDPKFEPIYKDIATHNKTLIAHLAEPDEAWGIPVSHINPDTASYYAGHSQWKMTGIPGAPSKQKILIARDHLLAMNPHLRVVGAHLGSMESDVDLIAQRFDRYPNFAVDTAGRVPYLTYQPREKVRKFIIKYQDRILYGTDNSFQKSSDPKDAIRIWQEQYAQDWRYFATTDHFSYEGYDVQGLGLPPTVLKKLFHDNAIRWFPGLGNSFSE